MTLIISGGRDRHLSAADLARLDALVEAEHVTEVLHGAQRGVDKDADRWARRRKLPVRTFPADWGLHGSAAGPVRNAAMAASRDGGSDGGEAWYEGPETRFRKRYEFC